MLGIIRNSRGFSTVHAILGLVHLFVLVVGLYTLYNWYKQKRLIENTVVMVTEIDQAIRPLIGNSEEHSEALERLLYELRHGQDISQAVKDYVAQLRRQIREDYGYRQY